MMATAGNVDRHGGLSLQPVADDSFFEDPAGEDRRRMALA